MLVENTGFGTPRSEEKILNEVNALVKHVLDLNGNAYDPKIPFANLTGNVLISVLLNKHYTWNSEEMKRLQDVTEGILNSLLAIDDLGFMDQFLPKFLVKMICSDAVKQCERQAADMKQFIKEQIIEHRAKFDPNQTPDFIDYYLKEGKDKSMTENVFVNTLTLFFPDATGTTSDALNWAILFLAHHPQEQEAAQKQLDEVSSKALISG